MQLDYVDLVFCHRPDPYTPVEETVRAMSDLVDPGQGVLLGHQRVERPRRSWKPTPSPTDHLTRRTMEQPQYNMFHRERVEHEYERLYREIGLGTTICSPLASGLLTGKYNDGMPEGSRGAAGEHAQHVRGADRGQEGSPSRASSTPSRPSWAARCRRWR